MKYPEIPVESLALRVQARDLGALSTPLTKGTLTTNRRNDIWRLRKGQKVRLQAPEDGVADMIVVLGDIDYGNLKDGRIKMKVVADVYSMPETTYVASQPSQTPPLYTPPAAPPAQRLIEAPYVEVVANLSAADLAVYPDDTGVIMAMATEPSSGLNYTLYTAQEGGELTETGAGEWCPTALIVEAAGYLDTSFTMSAASRLDHVGVGSWALWDDEIVRVDAIDEDALTLTLGRGCADTVPWQHDANSRIWFCGDWAATDGAQYLDGETVSAALLTRTTIDELPLESAALLTVDMDQRWFRPYPPAGLLINSESYPEEPSGDLTVEWADRDRVMQSDQLIDASVASIGPEGGTTYDIELWDRETGTLYHSVGSVSSPATVLDADVPYLARLMVWAVRDGLRSWQAATAEFTHGNAVWSAAALNPAIWQGPESDIALVSSAVSNISNLGALGVNGDYVQSTTSRRPTVVTGAASLRAIRYNGTQQFLQCASPAARALFAGQSAGWVCVVMRKLSVDASAVNRGIVTNPPGSAAGYGRLNLGIGASAANRLYLYSERADGGAGALIESTAALDTSAHIIVARVNWGASEADIWVDGTLWASSVAFGTSGTVSATSGYLPAGIGAYVSATPYTHCDMDLSELLQSPGVLSDEDRQRLEGSFAWLYGLVDNLPVDHPYKDARPMEE